MDLATITSVLQPIAPLWYQLGLQLGIQPQVLDRIECDYSFVLRRLTEVVKFWLNNCEGKAWKKIATALRRIHLANLAFEVEQYDGQGLLALFIVNARYIDRMHNVMTQVHQHLGKTSQDWDMSLYLAET